MTEKNLLYIRAYEMLERITPLKSDCGVLCGRACCRGIEEDAGMWLFPGEEEIAAREASFYILPSGRRLKNGRILQMMVCEGNCPRSFRPLSCRIFPLAPYLTENGIVTTDIDPRAKSLCPLTRDRGLLRPDFIRNVARVCRELAREPEIIEFIEIWTGEIKEYRELGRLFGRKI